MTLQPYRQTHVAVIGGGFTGMVCALNLSRSGYRVTLFEAAQNLGGLTNTHDFEYFRWDRFYHCILTSDSALLDLIHSLELDDSLMWSATKVGFFTHGELHPMTSPADLLRFPHLSIFAKLRLISGTLYAAHICNGKNLEHVPLQRWTEKVFGRKVFCEIWDPLFRCKLGSTRTLASAAFLWSTIRRLYSTRDKGANKQERLGYVDGGYATIFERLTEKLVEHGVVLRTGSPVNEVHSYPCETSERQSSVCIFTDGHGDLFDAAVLTLPNRQVSARLPALGTEDHAKLAQVCYLGLICIVLVLRRRLSPYYVTNITETSPFTGIIEMTNLIDPESQTAGLHLVYLPLYTEPTNELFEASDHDVWRTFEPGLKKIHPSLNSDDIVERFVFRERCVQPVPTIGYSAIVPGVRTSISGVYLANTAQIQNNTLNNNVMTEFANRACEALMEDIPNMVVAPESPAEHVSGESEAVPSCMNPS